MFDVKISPEQIQYAEYQVNTYDFGQRFDGNGDKRMQRTGIIGQTVFADLIGAPRPNGADGFDGGSDYVINGKKIDIKTMTRKCPVKDFYVHNFVGYQAQFEVDYYIFASFNTSNDVLSICGYVDKDTLFERAEFFPIGTMRTRSDGTQFQTRAPLYEIRQDALFQVNDLDSLLAGIS